MNRQHAMTSVVTNLGLEAPDFIGRGEELSELFALLDKHHLVTLQGPPGVGKTRLARQIAHRAVSAGELAEVWFCPLASARDEQEICRIVASSLDIPLNPRLDTTAQLENALCARGPMLLILDNMEHVLEPGRALVARLAAAATDARFLVTSRRRLDLADERVLRVEPLEHDEAVELFVAAARRGGAELEPTPEITAIVDHLERLPLAIELAAARADFFAPELMLRRLQKSLRVFRDAPDRPARQATLDGAVQWSWDLLHEAERSALVQCAAFAQPFRLEAAEAILSLPDEADALDTIESLVRHSLLHEARDGSHGLQMYAFVHRFAADRLAQRSDEGEIFERHAAWFAERGRQALDELDGPEGREALEQLRRDLDNLSVVVERGARFPRLAIEACSALARVFAIRGPLEDWQRIVEAGSELATEQGDAKLRVDMLRAHAEYEAATGRLDLAQRHLDAAVELVVESDIERALGVALDRANLLRSRGELSAAEAMASHARDQARAAGRFDMEATALALRGLCLLNQPHRAIDNMQEAARLFQQVGNVRREATMRVNLGVAYLNDGQLELARIYQREALDLSQALGDRRLEAAVLSNLGLIENHRGEIQAAREHFSQALVIARRSGQKSQEGTVRVNLGATLAHAGDFSAAREHLVVGQRIQRDGSNVLGENHTGVTLANIDHAEGAVERALLCYDDAIVAFEEAGAAAIVAETLLYGSVAHRELGRPDEAVRYVRRALDSAQRAGDLRWRAVGEALLATYADDDGQRSAARADAAHMDPSSIQKTALALVDRERDAPIPWIGGRVLLRALDAAARAEGPTPDPGSATPKLSVGPAGNWFRLGEQEPVDMKRRTAPRLLLVAFAQHREQGTDEGLALEELFEIGWPGQSIGVEAANKRVYSAVRTLRRLGLDSVLITTDRGYMLMPELNVVRSEDSISP